MLQFKIQKCTITSVLIFLILFVSSCSCQGPDDWEVRHNAYQPPQRVMDSIGVKPGMVVAEIGAGRGRYVVHMAQRVGMNGKIYANDIDSDKLDYLNQRCRRDNIKNVETILGRVTDPCLPPGKIDLVYIINTYHHLEDPIGLLKNLKHGLKEDGRVAIIEHDPEKLPDGGSHSTDKEVLIAHAKESGLSLIKMQNFLERDTIYIFKFN